MRRTKKILAIALLSFCTIQAYKVSASELPLENAQLEEAQQPFQLEGTVLVKYTGTDENVVVPNIVTEIKEEAFWDCDTIKRIEIPDTVTKIGKFAFSNCEQLEEVVLPNQLKVMEGSLFEDCKNLKKVVIPDSVVEIRRWVFAGCSSLKKVEIPNTVIKIGRWVFNNCFQLEEVNLPNQLKKIEHSLFSGCKNLNTIVIPSTVIEIEPQAFYSTGLTSINIPNTVTKIGGSAFSNCIQLKEVRLPNQLKIIENSLFEFCQNLKKVVIPDSIIAIEGNSFRACGSLEILEIPKSVKRVDGGFSEESPWWKEQVKKSPLVIINDNLVKVSNYAKEDGKKLVIPKGVKRISKNAFDGSGTEYIEEVEIPNTVTAIGSGAFIGKSIKEINIPDSVIKMGGFVFEDCKKLEKVKLSRNLKTIPEYTFDDCRSLKQITIPESVTKMETDPFSNCLKLKDIVVSSKLKDASAAYFNYPKGIVIHAPKGSYMEKIAKEETNAIFKPLAINKKTATIKTKKNVQLNVGTDTTFTTWKSSNPSIASVNSSGKVTGKKKGTATITGILYGKKYTCKVKVS